MLITRGKAIAAEWSLRLDGRPGEATAIQGLVWGDRPRYNGERRA